MRINPNILYQIPSWLQRLVPGVEWRGDTAHKCVYLTFDDGPIPEATPFILETLRKYNIKATFFMVGDNVRKYPRLKDEVERRGHRLGNHTFNHVGGFECTSKEYLWNAHLADRLLRTHLFRPPKGWMRPLQYLRLRRHFTIIMWDLVTRDYSKKLTPEQVLGNVKRFARNGSIIVFHDSIKAQERMKWALPRAIEWLLAQGYKIERIPM